MIQSKTRFGRLQRSHSPECYNSDSEVLYTHSGGGYIPVDSRGFASDYETYANAISDDDPIYSIPKIPSSGSTELEELLKKFNTLSQELQEEQSKLTRQLSTSRDKTGNEKLSIHNSSIMVLKGYESFTFFSILVCHIKPINQRTLRGLLLDKLAL